MIKTKCMNTIRGFIVGLTLLGASSLHAQTATTEIDFSSIAAMQKSVVETTEGMTQEEKEAFGKALIASILDHNPLTANVTGFARLGMMASLGDKLFEGASSFMKGVTVADIKAAAKIDEDKERAASSANQSVEQQQECLNRKVNVIDPSLVKGDFGYSIEVSIKNDLKFAIRSIHVSYVIMQNGRSVPIIEDNVSSEISAGIEPGETRRISLWTNAKSEKPDDTTVTMKMLNVSDPKNRRLIDNNIDYLSWSKEISPEKCE